MVSALWRWNTKLCKPCTGGGLIKVFLHVAMLHSGFSHNAGAISGRPECKVSVISWTKPLSKVPVWRTWCWSSDLGTLLQFMQTLSVSRWSEVSIYTKRWWWMCEHPSACWLPPISFSTAAFSTISEDLLKTSGKIHSNWMEVFSLSLSLSLHKATFFIKPQASWSQLWSVTGL